jgi:organic hydroperoxide reductase OsmC/OhrA
MNGHAATGAAPLYVSEVTVEPGDGSDKLVTMAAEPGPIVMGAHGIIAQRLGATDSHEPHATTLDYLVAAAAACLTGTFARAMKARGVILDAGCYQTAARGEVHDRGGVLVLTRIDIRHMVRVAPEQRAIAERVHRIYEKGCAVSRSIAGTISLNSVLVLE